MHKREWSGSTVSSQIALCLNTVAIFQDFRRFATGGLCSNKNTMACGYSSGCQCCSYGAKDWLFWEWHFHSKNFIPPSSMEHSGTIINLQSIFQTFWETRSFCFPSKFRAERHWSWVGGWTWFPFPWILPVLFAVLPVFFFKAVLFPWFLLLEPLSLEMLEVKLLGEQKRGMGVARNAWKSGSLLNLSNCHLSSNQNPGYLQMGMKYYPVIWGLFHKPWNKDP